jgi:hypothetical protein
MTSRATACVLALALALAPPAAVAGAQSPQPAQPAAPSTIDGTAEWTVDRNASSSNNQSNANSSFWQNYALGFASYLVDPRILKFKTEGLFRTSSLTSGGTAQGEQQGHQGDLGYKLGAGLFPASAFPFFFQASRDTSGSSGDLGPSNPIRSGMIAPSGAPPLDFQSLNKNLTLGWQLGLGNLPRVELGYHRGSSVVTGGGYRAQQSDDDLSAAIFKDTVRTRQSFRFQQTSFENQLAQTFIQRLNNLDYDLGVSVTAHTSLTAHGGRRTTFAQSPFASSVVDPSAGAYSLPSAQGGARSEYVTGGYSYDPTGRVSLRLNGTFDRQTGQFGSTNDKLATLTSHVEVIRGLTVTGSGTTGVRGQMLVNVPVTVSTRSGVAGVSYQAGPRWLSGNVAATRGMGSNVTPEGRKGTSDSWSREASLSSTLGWLGLGTGYERITSRDGILDFGNYDSERVRASVQAQAQGTSLTTSAEQLRIDRGMAATFAHNVQRTFSGTAAFRLWRQSLATATAGGFTNDYVNPFGIGRDQTLFYGVGGQTSFRSLRATASIRSEAATATKTGYNQQGLNGSARLEYRLRTLNVAVEYRRNYSLLQYAEMLNPDSFRGRQLRLSIIRQFGFRVR